MGFGFVPRCLVPVSRPRFRHSVSRSRPAVGRCRPVLYRSRLVGERYSYSTKTLGIMSAVTANKTRKVAKDIASAASNHTMFAPITLTVGIAKPLEFEGWRNKYEKRCSACAF